MNEIWAATQTEPTEPPPQNTIPHHIYLGVALHHLEGRVHRAERLQHPAEGRGKRLERERQVGEDGVVPESWYLDGIKQGPQRWCAHVGAVRVPHLSVPPQRPGLPHQVVHLCVSMGWFGLVGAEFRYRWHDPSVGRC